MKKSKGLPRCLWRLAMTGNIRNRHCERSEAIQANEKMGFGIRGLVIPA